MKNVLQLKKNRGIVFKIMLALLITLSANTLFAQKQVKNIVLVHGAFADGSGWEEVYKILKKKGFNVSVAANPNISFSEDVAAAKRSMDRLDGQIILVGHSYGGAIITEAGNSDKVAGLVYIAAFAPDAGETLLQLVQSGPPTPNSGIETPSADGFIWYGKAKFHSGFCADLSKEKADFMYDSQVPIAASAFGATVSKAAWKTKPSWYVVATDDQTVPIEGARFMAKRANAKITEIKASHAVYVSQAKAVADVIVRAANESLK
ncbi:alpha/beta fold hydrolase [Flavobacterium sp. ACN6]|uniref:alpha/beta fold hydrolase n=1 Tax=Flavobacterium sp. ACN6 TaxID=1920426 RepID=UPI000BB2FD9B|nr:alpha/beta hydrolase [Flavobacterium sp. ACN6]PBJ10159.1 Pyrethroid hydrolase [Flavobacterium sp. ACN6]